MGQLAHLIHFKNQTFLRISITLPQGWTKGHTENCRNCDSDSLSNSSTTTSTYLPFWFWWPWCLFVHLDGKEKQIETATLTNECPVIGIYHHVQEQFYSSSTLWWDWKIIQKINQNIPSLLLSTYSRVPSKSAERRFWHIFPSYAALLETAVYFAYHNIYLFLIKCKKMSD